MGYPWCIVGTRPPSSQSHELALAKVTRRLVKVLKPRNQAQKSKDSSEPASLISSRE